MVSSMPQLSTIEPCNEGDIHDNYVLSSHICFYCKRNIYNYELSFHVIYIIYIYVYVYIGLNSRIGRSD